MSMDEAARKEEWIGMLYGTCLPLHISANSSDVEMATLPLPMM